jgi:cation diffusion facilitator CzcD-associated flavoprotein CzcO
VIIFATGFDVEHALGPITVRGRGGADLGALADGGLAAYKGATGPGFPNFFMITGPNTGLGHNSMIYMIESSVNYAVKAIELMRHGRVQSVEVKADVTQQYNQRIQARLQGTVWSSGCKSWYLSGSGKNFALWPGCTFQYRGITRRFDAAAYLVSTAETTDS